MLRCNNTNIGIYFGIKVMILGMWVNTLISYYLNSYWSGRMINYPMREQIVDITPGFLIAISMGAVVIIVGWYLPGIYLVKLLVQLLAGILITVLLCELIKPQAYLELKNIFKLYFLKRLNVWH